jgi:hypothetical protein
VVQCGGQSVFPPYRTPVVRPGPPQRSPTAQAAEQACPGSARRFLANGDRAIPRRTSSSGRQASCGHRLAGCAAGAAPSSPAPDNVPLSGGKRRAMGRRARASEAACDRATLDDGHGSLEAYQSESMAGAYREKLIILRLSPLFSRRTAV